jgi:plastocyanin
MKRRYHLSLLLVTAAIAVPLAGCGGGSSASTTAKSTGTSTQSQSASGGSSTAVTISNFKFAPATLTVKHGARVTVTNDDSTAHTATADTGNSFDTGTIDPGSSKAITVSKAGSYAYHCSIHPFMHGTLVVK